MPPKQHQNVDLTGFMATGKTTVGKLRYAFVDTDEMISTSQGYSIPEFFVKFGEVAFRKMETETAKELARQSRIRKQRFSSCLKNEKRISEVF